MPRYTPRRASNTVLLTVLVMCCLLAVTGAAGFAVYQLGVVRKPNEAVSATPPPARSPG